MRLEHEHLLPDDAVLRPYVTNTNSNIYCLRNLPPEVVAVLFAYVSRSAATFRENLLKLLSEGDLAVATPGEDDGDEFSAAREKARKFHEKWVVGYGHASVAEHADIKYALEDVSVIASKVIEDNRLAAYTEKSSRYQVFDPTRFVTPPELMHSSLREGYETTVRELLSGYHRLFEAVELRLRERYPREDGVSMRAYDSTLRAKALDVVRYLLPGSCLTAIGMSCNARVAAHAINKLLSHPLGELQHIGERMLVEGRKVCPALLKYAGVQPHLQHQHTWPAEPAARLVGAVESVHISTPVRLECQTLHPERVLAAGLLYPSTNLPFDHVLAHVLKLDSEAVRGMLHQSLSQQGNFDWPPRAFERVMFRTEMVVDYGAFRDIQRHRMATQSPQVLGCDLGYDTPQELVDFGLDGEYHGLMRLAKETHAALTEQHGAQVASYVVPFAYRVRVLFDWNLRELSHFIKLRSGREGHLSYRSVAQRCYLALREQHPMLAEVVSVDMNAYDLERLEGEKKLDRKLGGSGQG